MRAGALFLAACVAGSLAQVRYVEPVESQSGAGRRGRLLLKRRPAGPQRQPSQQFGSEPQQQQQQQQQQIQQFQRDQRFQPEQPLQQPQQQQFQQPQQQQISPQQQQFLLEQQHQVDAQRALGQFDSQGRRRAFEIQAGRDARSPQQTLPTQRQRGFRPDFEQSGRLQQRGGPQLGGQLGGQDRQLDVARQGGQFGAGPAGRSGPRAPGARPGQPDRSRSRFQPTFIEYDESDGNDQLGNDYEETESSDPLSVLLEESTFRCAATDTGYYADETVDCKVFHYCTGGIKHSWVCPEGQTFHQIQLICMPQSAGNICKRSSEFHFVNDYLYKQINANDSAKPEYADRYSPNSAALGLGPDPNSIEVFGGLQQQLSGPQPGLQGGRGRGPQALGGPQAGLQAGLGRGPQALGGPQPGLQGGRGRGPQALGGPLPGLQGGRGRGPQVLGGPQPGFGAQEANLQRGPGQQLGLGRPGFQQQGLGQPGLGQPGLGQPGLGQPGLGQLDLRQPGLGQLNLGQPGLGQPGSPQGGAGRPRGLRPGRRQSPRSQLAAHRGGPQGVLGTPVFGGQGQPRPGPQGRPGSPVFGGQGHPGLGPQGRPGSPVFGGQGQLGLGPQGRPGSPVFGGQGHSGLGSQGRPGSPVFGGQGQPDPRQQRGQGQLDLGTPSAGFRPQSGLGRQRRPRPDLANRGSPGGPPLSGRLLGGRQGGQSRGPGGRVYNDATNFRQGQTPGGPPAPRRPFPAGPQLPEELRAQRLGQGGLQLGRPGQGQLDPRLFGQANVLGQSPFHPLFGFQGAFPQGLGSPQGGRPLQAFAASNIHPQISFPGF